MDLSINPGREATQNFTVQMKDASTHGFSCFISMLDSELSIIDEREFNVTLKESAAIEGNVDLVELGSVEVLAATPIMTMVGDCPECQGIGEIFCMAWN